MINMNYQHAGPGRTHFRGICRYGTARAAQRGVTLVVSLLFLLLLTIIGVTSMSTGTLQERMAGNTRDLDVAMNAAESSLRFGEELFTQTYQAPPGKPEYILGYGAISGIWPVNTMQIDDKSWWTANGVLYNNDTTRQITDAAEDPRHYIEFSHFVKDNKDPNDDRGWHVYRITARGVGVSGLATSVLQSHYAARWD